MDVAVPCLAFADDLLIFSNGGKKSLDKVMGFIDHFEGVSGQLVNKGKSCFIVSATTPPPRVAIVQKATGFQRGAFPVSYLGVPIHKGRKKVFLYDSLLTKVRERIHAWEDKHLSFGGRLTLIQTTLTALPLYIMQSVCIPSTVLERLKVIINQFLWQGNSVAGTNWCSWDRLCGKYEEGGSM